MAGLEGLSGFYREGVRGARVEPDGDVAVVRGGDGAVSVVRVDNVIASAESADENPPMDEAFGAYEFDYAARLAAEAFGPAAALACIDAARLASAIA